MPDVTVDQNSLLELSFSLHWNSSHASHSEVLFTDKFNVWRDLDWLPQALQQIILDKPVGFTGSARFKAGEVLEPWSDTYQHTVNARAFNRQPRPGLSITPHTGRFYPQGWVADIPDVYKESMKPGRLVSMSDETMSFDFNHPMASHDVDIGVEIHQIGPAPSEHGGRCAEHLKDLLQGPGMQARYNGVATDFFASDALTGMDERPDTAFYSMTRMVPHLDKRALQQVEQLYQRLIPEQSRVLDLMASWDSHLGEAIRPISVTGLGLNEAELKANPQLDDYVIQDINHQFSLPFEDAHFDAVVCTVSVEYLSHPIEIFREVARILKPGGVFINTFSDRWFPTKAITLWTDLHEFERLGLVTEYYLQSDGFRHVHTQSVRGLPRPQDDPHAGERLLSDPVYAVWGSKI